MSPLCCPVGVCVLPGFHPGGSEEVRPGPAWVCGPYHRPGDRRAQPGHGAGDGLAGALPGADEALSLRPVLPRHAPAEGSRGQGREGEAEGHDPRYRWGSKRTSVVL